MVRVSTCVTPTATSISICSAASVSRHSDTATQRSSPPSIARADVSCTPPICSFTNTRPSSHFGSPRSAASIACSSPTAAPKLGRPRSRLHVRTPSNSGLREPASEPGFWRSNTAFTDARWDRSQPPTSSPTASRSRRRCPASSSSASTISAISEQSSPLKSAPF